VELKIDERDEGIKGMYERMNLVGLSGIIKKGVIIRGEERDKCNKR
jgi:hypothetical protein